MSPESKEYLDVIFNRSADGLLICDNTGRILRMNQAAERLNGIRAQEVVGKDVKTLLEEGQINRSATQEVLETRRRVSLIQTTPRSGYTLLVTGTPVFDRDGGLEFVVVNERDISLIEDMRRELVRARQESEKMRDKLAELSLMELTENTIVARSQSMEQTLGLAMKLAGIDASDILIQGESGTGKGLLAKFIHKNSPRARHPFIQINCAALPENLLEAELFGYEKGAFTGARETGKAGLFELASKGTLFLDEIGELSQGVQAKLLKYLDDHEIMPVGGLVPKKIDCAIIAATNRNLDRRTLKKKFRLDLFHRLNTFTLTIPPLRERPEDILELTGICLKRYNKRYNRRTYIGYKAYDALKSHSFPGNVRELINIIKQAVVMCDRRFLDDYILRAIEPARTEAPARAVKEETDLGRRLLSVEYEMLAQAAMRCRTTREAAGFLGISQPTLVRKMKKHGIAMKRSLL
ncbi:sigma-54 interaction domain-containing protein [Desulfospira joergensenii]|uniref:sigma-54 interaction domain-containing protein n=1 Tax=Desulfospira joergensenii TaxID=53329 RepID=UPI00040F5F0E|nr:sigma 54-interacting transcriptional regulator [Desulfospira joergensenii]